MRTLVAIVFMVAAAPVTAAGSSVRHVPPGEAMPDRPLVLDAAVSRAWQATLTLHFRPLGDGDGDWRLAEFRRDGDRWLAEIPGDAVRPPGVEYFIDAEQGGAVSAEFASAALPHVVVVRPAGGELRRARDLDSRGGGRSRISAGVDHVDFGRREVAGQDSNDRFYRVEADWNYLVLRYPLKGFRIGYSRLVGTTPAPGIGGDAQCTSVSCAVGYKVGGWFELRFALLEGVELDLRGAVMATAAGASPGGRVELRVGVEDGSHIALGGEVLADVGASGFFRLGWATVPGLPMAVTVEATDYPASERPTAVRLLYDVYHPFANRLRLGARLGYQARDERVGGVALGLRGSVDF
jgi:hypothetical protein